MPGICARMGLHPRGVKAADEQSGRCAPEDAPPELASGGVEQP